MYEPGYFRGKKITVMGLGLLGGIGEIMFLADAGADLVITDLKKPGDLTSSLDALQRFPNIRFTLGRHDLSDFRNRDLIVKAPSTPMDSPFIAEAKRNRIPVTMWAALFSRFARAAGATVAGVTGTRGKSTVTALLAHTLRTAGKRVIEGGNLRGTSLLSHLPELGRDAFTVLELDSWKLQGFGEERLSPHASVFTNLMPDHMNYYKGDMDAYFDDKANIFKWQEEGDTLVVGMELFEGRREQFASANGSVVIADERDVPKDWDVKLPGVHNRKNIACAIAAAEALGVDRESIRRAVESFKGIEGRLEFLGEKDGVKIYNDTNSTTPDATLAGLEALARNKNVVLIMGGADKTLDMSKLVLILDRYCKKIVLLPGTGTDRLSEFGFGSVATPVGRADSLPEAVASAVSSAAPGDIVLLSPAFASFGLFKNEYDRGDQFKEIVAGLVKK